MPSCHAFSTYRTQPGLLMGTESMGSVPNKPDKNQEDGCLVYVKNSITGQAPIDIRQYRDAHPDFPHEDTADRWVDEDQFEAYDHLGRCASAAVYQIWLEGNDDDPGRQTPECIRVNLAPPP